MDSYFKFTRLDEDMFAMDIFNVMSNEKLENILDNYFNELEDYLTLFAVTFKLLFKGKDYDEFYYQAKALVEQNNDIKIILNILAERNINE